MTDLALLYRARFPDQDLARKQRIWDVLCREWFQRFVSPEDTVLDMACGYGEFINTIQARRKLGLDLNPDTPRHLSPTVEFHQARADHVPGVADGSVDVVFTSNFLEHLPDKAALSAVMAEVNRMLRPGGRFMVMGPNIRYVGGAYWDFVDHHLPLTERSLGEAMALAGLTVERSIARFLPYTTRSALPQHPMLVSLYLKVPLAWQLLGGQFFVVGRKEETR